MGLSALLEADGVHRRGFIKASRARQSSDPIRNRDDRLTCCRRVPVQFAAAVAVLKRLRP